MSASKLLDQVRNTARLRHLSLRTEKAYVQHIKRFILFHQKRHPRELSVPHIRDYLSDLAVSGNVSASTQNVALETESGSDRLYTLLWCDGPCQTQPFFKLTLGPVATAPRSDIALPLCSLIFVQSRGAKSSGLTMSCSDQVSGQSQLLHTKLAG